jgi:hypothetical protein
MSIRTVRTLAGVLMVLSLAGCNLPMASPTPPPTSVPTLTPPASHTPSRPPPSGTPGQAPTLTLMPTAPRAATATTTVTPTVTPTASPTAPPAEDISGLPPTPADVLLSENFDAPSPGWYAISNETDASALEGGVYYVAVNVPGRWAWRLGPAGSTVKDLVIQADARLSAANPNAVYGFVCRYDSATQSFYNFSITGDGRYRIARASEGGDWTFLVDFGGVSGAIWPAPQWNQVEAGCVGSTLWLRVNGVLVASAQDTAHARPGDFGFWAQTRQGASQARAEYDNLVIRASP